MRVDKSTKDGVAIHKSIHDGSKGYVYYEKGQLFKTEDNPQARNLVICHIEGITKPKRFLVIVPRKSQEPIYIGTFESRSDAEKCALGITTFYSVSLVIDVNYQVPLEAESLSRDRLEDNNVSRNWHPEQGDDN